MTDAQFLQSLGIEPTSIPTIHTPADDFTQAIRAMSPKSAERLLEAIRQADDDAPDPEEAETVDDFMELYLYEKERRENAELRAEELRKSAIRWCRIAGEQHREAEAWRAKAQSKERQNRP